MVKQEFSKQNKDRGFTLVELIVVLVLLAILAAISVAGILSWQDWSRFKKENTAAETIFYAAQNQIAELSATGVYEDEVIRVINKLGSNELGGNTVATDKYFGGDTIRYASGASDYYRWQPEEGAGGIAIWANTPQVSSDDRAKYQGSIYYLSARAGDYDKYKKDPNFGEDTGDLGAKLLFDLITPYISDRSVLNGAINLEFSPEAMQVFSVCYSDRADVLAYDESADAISVLDRSEATRRDVQMGYFAADSLSMPLEGKRVSVQNELVLVNKETLHLIINEEAPDLDKEYNVVLCKTAGTAIDTTDTGKLMTITFRLKDLNSSTLSDASSDPTTVSATFHQGEYSGETKELRVPIYTRVNPDNSAEKQIIMVLDAADVQAQSFLYAEDDAPDASFLKTYSFYRYGFTMSDLYRIGCLLITEDNTAGSISNLEYPTFEKYEEKDGEYTYSIANGRHLYNVRYETDYKKDDTRRTFLLTDDIDWKDFNGANGGTNYYLDSYKKGEANAGIAYDGLDHTINRSDSALLTQNTTDYAFPGFRSLGINDRFTGLAEGAGEDRVPHTISNLTITFAANMTYGVYGSAAREEWINGNFANFGKFNGNNSVHASHGRAVKGELPLGLFAENSGEITNLTLNAHRVIGMEKLTYGNDNSQSVLVYTNMVGGFTGDNLGKLSNLTLRDVKSLSDEDTRENEAGVTHINGKTDVGGILGRQSWVSTAVQTGNTPVQLTGLVNYGEVTGMENIGGIVGRAYVIRGFDTLGCNSDFNTRKSYYEDGYTIFGQYGLSGNRVSITPGESITGEEVVCAPSIEITECSNRGRIAGDSLIASGTNIVTFYGDEKNEFRRCANIGGIAGITMDGYFIENFSKPATAWYSKIKTEDRKVTMENCDSYRLYTDTELESLISTPGGAISGDIKNSIEHDFYVGGLVGYARLTKFKNCTNEPLDDNGNLDTDKQTRSFVFGRNYVGGLFGCFDGSDIQRNKVTDRYLIENYTNAIGIMFTGGFAGSSGIGDDDIKTFSFKYPSMNEGSQCTLIPGDKDVLTGICNHGAILPARRDKLDYEDGKGIVYLQDTKIESGVTLSGTRTMTGAPDASVGGVIGIAASSYNDLDNLQSDEVKALVLKLVGYTGDYAQYLKGKTDVQGANGKSAAEALAEIQKYSYYGGNAVGGVVGKLRGNVVLNGGMKYSSQVNAVVWGFDSTGGIWGGAGVDKNSKNSEEVNMPINVYNSYVNGGVILGRDSVGGIGGRANTSFNSDSTMVNPDYSQKYPMHVVGRYGVGGAFGHAGMSLIESVSAIRSLNVNITGSETVPILVEACALAGGYAGLINSTCTLKGRIEKVSVAADYYAGGAFGGIYSATNSKDKLDREVEVVGANVVANTAFAGGYCGLYGKGPKVGSNDLCLIYSEYANLTKFTVNYANILLRFLDQRLCNDPANKTDLYHLLSTVAAAETNASGSIAAFYSSPTTSYDTKSFSGNIKPVDGVSVTAKIFAGGLFGYITPNCNVNISYLSDQPINTKVTATGAIQSNGKDLPGSNRWSEWNNEEVRTISYAGGVVGRNPVWSKITNANYIGELQMGTSDPNHKGSYIGQITEVNDGMIESCQINAFHTKDSKTTYAGGLAGLNSGNGSFGKGITFAGINLGSGDYEYVGGLAGENIGTINVNDLNALNDSAAQSVKAHQAAGLLTGYNGAGGIINTYSSNANYKLTSARIKETPYAGIYAGVNRGIIKNSNVETYLNDPSGSLIGILDASDNTGYSVNAAISVNDCTSVGLLAGKNIGTIQNIFIKSDGSKQKGAINISENDCLGGIAGQNGDAAKKGIIENCLNTLAIGDKEKTKTAAGIAGTIGGNSTIENCMNAGDISALQSAGGIQGTIGGNYTVTVNDCVNLGTLAVAEGGMSAGISVGMASDAGVGTYTLCRNYGTGAQYGISAANAASMIKCLDNSGLDEGTAEDPKHPLAPNDNIVRQSAENDPGLIRNFYISGTVSAEEVAKQDNEEEDQPSGEQVVLPIRVDEVKNKLDSIEKPESWNDRTNDFNSIASQIYNYYNYYNVSEASITMAELEYIHLMKFMGDYYNAGMNSFLSQLYAYYILFELGEDMTFEMSAFEEYVVDCVKTGEINKPKDKEVLQNTIEVNRGVVNINFEKYEGFDSEANALWNSNAQDFINMITLYSGVTDPNMAYYYYGICGSPQKYEMFVKNVYKAYLSNSQNSDTLLEDFKDYLKKVVAEGKIPGSDTPHTGDDNSHWPVQLYYYKKNDEDAEELEQGLYFKRMNYHYAGIAPEELDPTDIADTTAKNRFNAVDAQFIAMANDETNYPNNDTESHKGFVK